MAPLEQGAGPADRKWGSSRKLALPCTTLTSDLSPLGPISPSVMWWPWAWGSDPSDSDLFGFIVKGVGRGEVKRPLCLFPVSWVFSLLNTATVWEKQPN